MSASWGCHTCGQIEESSSLTLARRRSVRHELREHGFTVYTERAEIIQRAVRENAQLWKRAEVGAGPQDARTPQDATPEDWRPTDSPATGDAV